jgi:hypothetical protein
MPVATPANAALAGLSILGTAEIAECAQRMQQCLADLTGAAVTGKRERVDGLRAL